MPCKKVLLVSKSQGSTEKYHARLHDPELGEELLKHTRLFEALAEPRDRADRASMGPDNGDLPCGSSSAVSTHRPRLAAPLSPLLQLSRGCCCRAADAP